MMESGGGMLMSGLIILLKDRRANNQVGNGNKILTDGPGMAKSRTEEVRVFIWFLSSQSKLP